MRPIDADTIFPKGHVLVWEKDGETTANYILKLIKEAPTLDVEPVRHGRWEYFNAPIKSVPVTDRIRCSECRAMFNRLTGTWYKFCSYCGAKMDAKENDDA